MSRGLESSRRNLTKPDTNPSKGVELLHNLIRRTKRSFRIACESAPWRWPKRDFFWVDARPDREQKTIMRIVLCVRSRFNPYRLYELYNIIFFGISLLFSVLFFVGNEGCSGQFAGERFVDFFGSRASSSATSTSTCPLLAANWWRRGFFLLCNARTVADLSKSWPWIVALWRKASGRSRAIWFGPHLHYRLRTIKSVD